MKRLYFALLAAVLVLSVGTTGALAASETRGGRYTDANKDGVCDVRGKTDADGDGVRDSCPNGGVCPRDGTGAQYGRMRGRSK